MVLICDNATPHKAALVKELLTNFSWSVFPHPPFSPNLNLVRLHAVCRPEECCGWKAVLIACGGEDIWEVISREP